MLLRRKHYSAALERYHHYHRLLSFPFLFHTLRRLTFQCCELLYAAGCECRGVCLHGVELLLLLLDLPLQVHHLLLQGGVLGLEPVAGQLRYRQVLPVLGGFSGTCSHSCSGQACSRGPS